MVVLNRIYTRTGDDGMTALGTGERCKKYDLRIACYGTVDETNAAIGVVRLHTLHDAEIDTMLGRIQNDLFDLGAELCAPAAGKGKGPGGARLTVGEAQVTRLETEMDRLNADLARLRSNMRTDCLIFFSWQAAMSINREPVTCFGCRAKTADLGRGLTRPAQRVVGIRNRTIRNAAGALTRCGAGHSLRATSRRDQDEGSCARQTGHRLQR